MKTKKLKKKTLEQLKQFQGRLFKEIKTLNDQNLTGDDLDQEIKRAMALNKLAKTAIVTNELARKAVVMLAALRGKE